MTIIGGGPAGLFASFYAGLRGMSVRIVDSLPELGGQLTALYPEKYIYDMPGFPKIQAKDLVAAMVEQGEEFDPELVLGETAEHLDRDGEGYTIRTRSGRALPTRTVLIAAGAGAFSPTKLGVPREAEFEGRGLLYGVRDRSSLEGKRLLIVGGGDSAFDWALDLHPIAESVTLLHRRDQFKAHEDTVQRVRSSGVEFMLWSVVRELIGNGTLEAALVENTQTKEVSRVDADAVIVNIGFKSSLGPILGWGLEIEKHSIVVDRLCRTNLEGVFAIGDVSTYEGKIKLIATGVGEAATAVCCAKTLLDPSAKLFPGHSSDMDIHTHPHGGPITA